MLQQVRERLGVGEVVDTTKSMSVLPSAARMMLRPMRPNPLIPTRTAIALSSRSPGAQSPSPEPKCDCSEPP